MNHTIQSNPVSMKRNLKRPRKDYAPIFLFFSNHRLPALNKKRHCNQNG